MPISLQYSCDIDKSVSLHCRFFLSFTQPGLYLYFATFLVLLTKTLKLNAFHVKLQHCVFPIMHTHGANLSAAAVLLLAFMCLISWYFFFSFVKPATLLTLDISMFLIDYILPVPSISFEHTLKLTTFHHSCYVLGMLN